MDKASVACELLLSGQRNICRIGVRGEKKY